MRVDQAGYVDIDTAAGMAGVSRRTVFDRLRKGEWKRVRDGRKTYVSVASITARVERLTTQEPQT